MAHIKGGGWGAGLQEHRMLICTYGANNCAHGRLELSCLLLQPGASELAGLAGLAGPWSRVPTLQ